MRKNFKELINKILGDDLDATIQLNILEVDEIKYLFNILPAILKQKDERYVNALYLYGVSWYQQWMNLLFPGENCCRLMAPYFTLKSHRNITVYVNVFEGAAPLWNKKITQAWSMAIKYFDMAITLNHPIAMYERSRMYEQIGVHKSKVQHIPYSAITSALLYRKAISLIRNQRNNIYNRWHQEYHEKISLTLKLQRAYLPLEFDNDYILSHLYAALFPNGILHFLQLCPKSIIQDKQEYDIPHPALAEALRNFLSDDIPTDEEKFAILNALFQNNQFLFPDIADLQNNYFRAHILEYWFKHHIKQYKWNHVNCFFDMNLSFAMTEYCFALLYNQNPPISKEEQHSELLLDIPSVEEIEDIQTVVSRGENLPGLTFKAIKGDGDCLYNAIGLHLNQDAQSLRNIVADYLVQNRTEYESVVTGLLRSEETFADYVNGIRNNAWGDDLEISILTRLLNRAILVIHPDRRTEHLDVINTYPNEPIFIAYNGHNHYNAYIRNSELTIEEIFAHLTQATEYSFSPSPPHRTQNRGLLLKVITEKEGDDENTATLSEQSANNHSPLEAYHNDQSNRGHMASRFLNTILSPNIGLRRTSPLPSPLTASLLGSSFFSPNKNKAQQSIDEKFSAILRSVSQQYKQKHLSKSWAIRGHGGKMSIKSCEDLENLAKKNFDEILLGLIEYLSMSTSGMRNDSLDKILYDALMKEIDVLRSFVQNIDPLLLINAKIEAEKRFKSHYALFFLSREDKDLIRQNFIKRQELILILKKMFEQRQSVKSII